MRRMESKQGSPYPSPSLTRRAMAHHHLPPPQQQQPPATSFPAEAQHGLGVQGGEDGRTSPPRARGTNKSHLATSSYLAAAAEGGDDNLDVTGLAVPRAPPHHGPGFQTSGPNGEGACADISPSQTRQASQGHGPAGLVASAPSPTATRRAAMASPPHRSSAATKIDFEQRSRRDSMLVPEAACALVGSFEESILSGRMSCLPSQPILFTAEIGVVGFDSRKTLKIPKHLVLEFYAYFYEFGQQQQQAIPSSSPYVGTIELPKDYRIPKRGHLQILVRNCLNTAIKVFLVPFDFSDMPPDTRTFIRQSTYATSPPRAAGPPASKGLPSAQSSHRRPLPSSPLTPSAPSTATTQPPTSSASPSPSPSSFATSSSGPPRQAEEGPARLAYAIQCPFTRLHSRKLYLSRAIRIVFSYRSLDLFEGYTLVTKTLMPKDPMYIPLRHPRSPLAHPAGGLLASAGHLPASPAARSHRLVMEQEVGEFGSALRSAALPVAADGAMATRSQDQLPPRPAFPAPISAPFASHGGGLASEQQVFHEVMDLQAADTLLAHHGRYLQRRHPFSPSTPEAIIMEQDLSGPAMSFPAAPGSRCLQTGPLPSISSMVYDLDAAPPAGPELGGRSGPHCGGQPSIADHMVLCSSGSGTRDDDMQLDLEPASSGPFGADAPVPVRLLSPPTTFGR